MANYKIIKPYILSWEGGFSNNPKDKGGATNKGITLKTFRVYYGVDKTVNDLKKITDSQWDNIFVNGYWNKIMGSKIESQSVANMLCDWYWMSGPIAVKKLQEILGLKNDGIFGPKTLAAVNAEPGELLFNRLKLRRKNYYKAIVEGNPSQIVFLKGWMNRLDHMDFEQLQYNGKNIAIGFKD